MDRTPEETAEGLNACNTVASLLSARAAEGTREDADVDKITRFHSLKPPSIPIEDYLKRIYTYSQCSNECLVLALIYVERLVAAPKLTSTPKTHALEVAALKLTKLTVHRVTVTAVMLAAKYLDDSYYNNAFFAMLGGVTTAEINVLERDFLRRTHFCVHVKSGLYSAVLVQLEMGGEEASSKWVYTTASPSAAVPIEMASADETIVTGGGSVAATPCHGAIVADATVTTAVCGGGGGGYARPSLLAVRNSGGRLARR
jgi:hypothetical protein